MRAALALPPRRWLAALAVAGLVAGCTSGVQGQGNRADGTTPSSVPSTSASPSASPSPTSTAPDTCPATYAEPDPKRPKVGLDFTVAADLATVTGRETVEFTPDAQITELVFRLTPNTAPSVEQGNKIVVTSATADHGATTIRFEQAGAHPSTQGGLLVVPFSSPVAAGTTVKAVIEFTVFIGANSFDRFGRAQGYAWFASAHPLLAWERGTGWHTEPMIQFTAESATSEAAQTDLSVTAPAGLTVIMTGNPTDGTDAGNGMRTWRASSATARDVSVSVGPFVVGDSKVGPVDLRIGARTVAERDALTGEFTRAITELAARFGPFPYPSLAVSRLPGSGGGIEYPGAIQMLDSSRVVAVHEVAHQWFYGLVGDSQATHAWLDEAFASYAEQLVDGSPAGTLSLNLPGAVDRPTADYGTNEAAYYIITYEKGAAALHAARAAAGPDAFDAAIRCFINANAWQIADPPDLERALAALPAAIEVLRKAQALR